MATQKQIEDRIYPAHKPKKGVEWILWWDAAVDNWVLISVSALDFGDIWRPELPSPSQRLQERAAKCARDWEEQEKE